MTTPTTRQNAKRGSFATLPTVRVAFEGLPPVSREPGCGVAVAESIVTHPPLLTFSVHRKPS